MKAKRLVAILLSVILLAGMIPLSVSAATATTIAETTITLQSTAEFGSTKELELKSGRNKVNFTADTFEKYLQLGDTTHTFQADYQVFDNYTGSMDLYTDVLKTKGATSSVEKGKPVYITVKITSKEANGVLPNNVYIVYDSEAFDAGSTAAVNVLQKFGGATGQARAEIVAGEETSAEYVGKVFGGDLEDSRVSTFEDKTTHQHIAIVPWVYNADKRKSENATGTDWDYVVPFTAKKTGTYTFSVITSHNGDASGSTTPGQFKADIPLAKVTGDGTNAIDVANGVNTYIANESADTSTLKTVPTTVTVTGPSLPPAISGITYDNTGKAKIEFTSDTDHAAATDLKYQVAGDDTWTAIPSTDLATNVWTPADALQNELIAGKTITVSSDDGKATANSVAIGVSATGTGKVNQNTVPTGTVIIFNYAAKTAVPTTANASKVEVRVGTGAWGASASIQDTKTQVYYRAKGDTNGIPSDGSKTYRTSTAAATNLTVATTTDWDKKIDGKTTLGAPASGATYKYNVGSAADKTTGTEFSAAVDVNATTTQTVYLYKAPTDGDGTADGTPAATGTVTGVGFAATGTMSATNPTTPTQDVVLTFAGDQGQFVEANKGDITITGDTLTNGTDFDVTLAASNSNEAAKATITLKNSKEWATGTTYTVTVPATAVKPNGQKTATFKLSQSGYLLAVGTENAAGTLTLSDSAYAGGAKKTITVNGLAANEGLSDVVPSDDSVTVSNITHKTFDIQADALTNTSKNITFNITVSKQVEVVPSVAKVYDGTTEVKASEITLSVTGVTGIDVEGMNIKASVKEADKNVTGNPVDVTITGEKKTVGDTTYTLKTTGIQTTITPATAGAISAEVSNIRENAGIDALITAILAAPVKVAGFPDQKTVADYVTVSAPETTKADEIKTLLKTATIGGTPIYTAAAPKTEVTFAADTTETGVTIDANSVAGSTWTFPADTTFVKDDGTELTADELAALGFTADGTKLTLGSEAIAAAGSFNAKISDSKSIAFTVGQITPKEEVAEESWKLVPGDLTVTIEDVTLSNFTGTGDKDIPVKVTIKKKGASGGVLYNTNGYATVADEEVEVDESGKITKLTAVTDVVKGASFVGWSTDGTKAHIVKEGATLGEDQEELIAVFDGYMSGMDASTMAPTKKVTRAQLLKMVLEAAGLFDYNHDYGQVKNFKDDNINTHWAARWIACAEQLGDKSPISGYEDGKFRPDRQVTREEAAIIIAKAFGVTVKEGGTTNKVSDFDKVSDWAKDYVAALCDNGTINGLDDGTFGGKRGTQRDAASTMVNKYLGLTEAEKKAIAESAEIQNPYKDVGKGNWAYADLMFASLKVPSSYYQTEITMPTATPATPAE